VLSRLVLPSILSRILSVRRVPQFPHPVFW
jgi:hypothetical protein